MIQAMGTKIKIGANSIAELTSVEGLDMSADTIESTTLDSNGWRTFIQGLKDAGEVSLSGFFNPGDTNGQKVICDLFDSGTLSAFTILFPSTLGASWDFSGIVTAIKTSADMEDAVTFEATIKVSGKPSLGLTQSAGLSALSLTGTGGVLTPEFANGTYSYTFSGVTDTSFTVTATAANHTIKLYVDGVYQQDLTSGSPSNPITISAIGSKKLTILASESGKTQKVYDIVVVKTA